MGKKGTVDLLKMLKGKNKMQYKDLSTIDIAISILSSRINVLLRIGFIEHHLKRTVKKEEWYTLTKKGERVLNLIDEIEEIVDFDQD